MNNLLNLLKKTVKKIYGYEGNFIIYDAKKGEGHYALKETMKLAGMQKKSGEIISKEILEEIKDSDLIEKCEIFKPGFLNIWLSDKILSEGLKEEKFDNLDKKVLIEYGNENIAKQMSVGHLRSNIIGKSLVNIFRKLNYRVETINHLGDYGTQFGKLIVAYKKWGNDEEIEKNPIEELNRIYVKFHEESEKNPELENEGREEFKKLEEEFLIIYSDEKIIKKLEEKINISFKNKDEKRIFEKNFNELFLKIAEKNSLSNFLIWQKFRFFSLKEFQKIYDILSSEFDFMIGESSYIPILPEIIKKLNNSAISETGEGGAKIISFGKKAPLMYLKSNNSTTYATRDLAAIKWRGENIKANKVFYCVGKEQSQHFQQVFEVAEKMGWNKGAKLIHVKNGLYKLASGEKFSTRKGNVIRLSELIKIAREKARELLETKDSFKNFETEEEKKQLVEALAIGAIKFTDLSQDRETDITFSWKKAITFEGMSGPYMQYAHARTCGILRKAKENKINISDFSELKNIKFTHQKEKDLAFFLSKYSEEIKRAGEVAKPHLIARYIYSLSQEFNSFYSQCSVLNAENKNSQNFRLFLTKRTQEIIGEGLELLGVIALKKM